LRILNRVVIAVVITGDKVAFSIGDHATVADLRQRLALLTGHAEVGTVGSWPTVQVAR
jgi:hypothetical protein